jgi:hypothetical protein
MWKSQFIFPLAVAILAAITTIYATRHLERHDIKIVSRAIEMPLAAGRSQQVENVIPALETATGLKGLKDVYEKIKFTNGFSLYSFEVKNLEKVRSKNIELKVPYGVAAFIVADPKSRSFKFISLATKEQPILVEPIDPEQTTTVLVLATNSTRFYPAQALHDNRKVDIVSDHLPEWGSLGLAALITHNAPLSEILIVICGAVLVTFIGLIIFAAIIDKNYEYRVKFTSKSSIEDLAKFIDYVKEHHPGQLERK